MLPLLGRSRKTRYSMAIKLAMKALDMSSAGSLYSFLF
jgi:hypothetical protein